jgi:lipoate-protein ligase A
MWRLIDSDLLSPPRTAAVEEALTLSHEGGGDNILHLYRRDRPTISVGYFQGVEESVDLTAAKERDVALVRRMTGGSTIYTDPGHLIYSAILSKDDLPADRSDAFAMICGGVVLGLRSLGLDAEHKPVNDVLVNGRKISGSAQRRGKVTIIQHGTVMVDTDLGFMERVLRPREGKVSGYAGLTTIGRELGIVPPMKKVKEAMVQGFSRTFGTDILPSALTEWEIEMADRLESEKYGRDEFTFLH